MEKNGHTKYPHLFLPFRLRGLSVKNRIVSAPHGSPFMFTRGAGDTQDFSDDAVYYYGAIARGGAGIVNTGHLGVDPRYVIGRNRLHFDFFSKDIRQHQIPVMRRMTELIHTYGAIASMDLNHAGEYSIPLNGGSVPGPCEKTSASGKKVHAMTEDEMNQVADWFAEAARVGIDGGFDMINIHMGHGWLLNQFLSPMENHRQDAYGGSVENRVRFPRLVLEKVRNAVGNTVPIKIRFSLNELNDTGYSIEEGIQSVLLMEDLVDLVQCTAGKISAPLSDCFTFPVQYLGQAVNSYLAGELKKQAHIPVEAVGAINDPEVAEQLLLEGTADFVGMARNFIADPNWGIKAAQGKPEDIRPCIRCVRCLNANGATTLGECTVNPHRVLYHESVHELPAKPKRVAVIGGGPAGMEAALELARRGHSVTLFEQSDRLGGTLNFSDYVFFKDRIKKYRDYLVTQIIKSSVTVQLNMQAKPQILANEGYQDIINATGAKPVIPSISGIRALLNDGTALFARDIFGQEQHLGQSIVIIGAGAVGCETAIHLASLGKDVTLLEKETELLKDSLLVEEREATLFYLTHRFSPDAKDFLHLPPADNIHLRLGYTAIEISGQTVTITPADNKADVKETVFFDTLILSVGSQPDATCQQSLEKSGIPVIPIGDAIHSGSIYEAVKSGFRAAIQIHGSL